MTWLTPILTAFNWLIDPKNRQWLTLGLILVLIFMLMGTCSRISSLQGEVKASQEETQRVRNNWQASQDSVKMEVGKNGELIGRIDGYVLTLQDDLSWSDGDLSYASLDELAEHVEFEYIPAK